MAAAALVAPVLVVLAPAAQAATSTTSFTFTGSTTQEKTLYDSGLIYIDGCDGALIEPDDPVLCTPDDFPGTFWGHLEVSVKTTVVRAAAGELTLERPDSFRQDATSSFVTTFVAKDAAGKEVTVRTEPLVSFQAAYDAPLANCSKDHVTLATLEAGIDASDPNECINFYGALNDVSLGDFTLLAQDATLPYTGSKTVSQTALSPGLSIIPNLLQLKLAFVTDLVLQATGGGAYRATRTLASSSAPGTALGTAPELIWPDATQQVEDVTLPCSVPAGDDLIYRLSNVRWIGDGDVNVSTHPVLAFELADVIDVDIDLPTLASVNIFDDGDLTSTAPPWQQVLGPVQAENKAPTVATPTPAGGAEGTPLTFAAVGSGPGGSFDNCDPTGAGLDFVWTFDDGAKAFGPTVQHSFVDNNGASSRSGQLVVTDPAGNKTTRNFSVAVSNAAPVVNAGPDTAAAWGRDVVFGGSATDPGAADQGTLSYSWDFGDGTPAVATGGATTTHAYGAPGQYTATLTVKDKDGGEATDTRVVTVRKRSVTAAYTGDLTGTFDSPSALSATLTDEYGRAVVGRSVAFEVSGEAVGTALTGALGRASRTWNVSVPAPGAGPAVASFDGTSDPLYDSADASSPFAITAKGTATTYTGSLKSQPNKVVSLSAVLLDAAGKPLAGRLVTFQLGTQQVVSEPTTATGVATATLKLAQKNGTKPLTATYTPAGSDVGKYLGSGASTTFRIG